MTMVRITFAQMLFILRAVSYLNKKLNKLLKDKNIKKNLKNG